MNPLTELSKIFQNKKQFEHTILECELDLPEEERERNSNIWSGASVKKMNIRASTALFGKQTSALAFELEKYIGNKLDVLADKNLKIEYLDEQLRKLYAVCNDIRNILPDYPINQVTLTNIAQAPLWKGVPLPESIVGLDDMADWMEDIFEWIQNADVDSITSSIENLTKEDLLGLCLVESYNTIKNLSGKIVVNHRHVLEDRMILLKDSMVMGLKPLVLSSEEITIEEVSSNVTISSNLAPTSSEELASNGDTSNSDNIAIEQRTTLSEETIQMISRHLAPLAGFWNNQKIMQDTEFQRLLKYSVLLVESSEIPDEIVPISNTNISIEFIRKTYHRLYKNLNLRNAKLWCSFLHRVFVQFNIWKEENTYKSFPVYRGIYEQDLKKIT